MYQSQRCSLSYSTREFNSLRFHCVHNSAIGLGNKVSATKHLNLLGSKNTLTQKIMVNGSTFLTLNYNFLVGLPSSEATLNRTEYSFPRDIFTIEILQIWSEVSFNPCVTFINHFLSSSLWHNSLIKIDNRPVFL